MELTIGELSRAAGVKIPTIRYYERIDLLPPGVRDEGNRRRYGQKAVQRLTFIRRARELGFDVDAIRELLRMEEDPRLPANDLATAARSHLNAVRARLARLVALEEELSRIAENVRCGRTVDSKLVGVLIRPPPEI